MAAIVKRDTEFEETNEAVRADDKGRVILGNRCSGKQFRVSVSMDGDVLLTPSDCRAPRLECEPFTEGAWLICPKTGSRPVACRKQPPAG